MKYTVRVTLITEGGNERIAERVIQLDGSPGHRKGERLAIDVDQLKRALDFAVDEAKKEVIHSYPHDTKNEYAGPAIFMPRHR